jgi:hypothetical protein
MKTMARRQFVRITGLVCELELNRTTTLLLSDCRAVDDVPLVQHPRL